MPRGGGERKAWPRAACPVPGAAFGRDGWEGAAARLPGAFMRLAERRPAPSGGCQSPLVARAVRRAARCGRPREGRRLAGVTPRGTGAGVCRRGVNEGLGARTVVWRPASMDRGSDPVQWAGHSPTEGLGHDRLRIGRRRRHPAREAVLRGVPAGPWLRSGGRPRGSELRSSGTCCRARVLRQAAIRRAPGIGRERHHGGVPGAEPGGGPHPPFGRARGRGPGAGTRVGPDSGPITERISMSAISAIPRATRSRSIRTIRPSPDATDRPPPQAHRAPSGPGSASRRHSAAFSRNPLSI